MFEIMTKSSKEREERKIVYNTKLYLQLNLFRSLKRMFSWIKM